MPAQARQACALATLPAAPVQADLEAVYAQRGADLVACDKARQLAVDTSDDEHRLQDQADAERAKRARPFWRLW